MEISINCDYSFQYVEYKVIVHLKQISVALRDDTDAK